MAKKTDPRQEKADLVKPSYPAGREPVARPGGFFTFETQGQELTGTLVGTETKERKNPKKGESPTEERWVFLPDGSAETVYLPNHQDLDAQLKALVARYAGKLPIQGVWIQLLGTRPAPKAKVPSGYVVIYAVAGPKAGEQQTL